VDEHAELRLAPPRHAGVALGFGFIGGTNGRSECKQDDDQGDKSVFFHGLLCQRFDWLVRIAEKGKFVVQSLTGLDAGFTID
jgi:hypothetical protein